MPVWFYWPVVLGVGPFDARAVLKRKLSSFQTEMNIVLFCISNCRYLSGRLPHLSGTLALSRLCRCIDYSPIESDPRAITSKFQLCPSSATHTTASLHSSFSRRKKHLFYGLKIISRSWEIDQFQHSNEELHAQLGGWLRVPPYHHSCTWFRYPNWLWKNKIGVPGDVILILWQQNYWNSRIMGPNSIGKKSSWNHLNRVNPIACPVNLKSE